MSDIFDVDVKFNHDECEPIFAPTKLTIKLVLETVCALTDETVTVIEPDTPIFILKKKESGKFHNIDAAQNHFNFNSGSDACGVTSIGIFSDALGTMPFGDSTFIMGNWNLRVPLSNDIDQ